jgi:hypothetical protein
MGIPEGTVLVRAKRECWTSTFESTLLLVSSVEITPAAKKAQGIAEAALQTRLELAQALHKAAEHAASLPAAELLQDADNMARLVKACALVFGWSCDTRPR